MSPSVLSSRHDEVLDGVMEWEGCPRISLTSGHCYQLACEMAMDSVGSVGCRQPKEWCCSTFGLLEQRAMDWVAYKEQSFISHGSGGVGSP